MTGVQTCALPIYFHRFAQIIQVGYPLGPEIFDRLLDQFGELLIGVELNGARSWINLGVTTFQPSEIVKLTYILLFANYLTKHKEQLNMSDFFIDN